MPSDSRVLVDLHHVRDVAGSTNELNLLVEVPEGRHVTDQDVLDWMLPFEERQRARAPERHPALEQPRIVHEVGERRRADDGIGGAGAERRTARACRTTSSTAIARWRRSRSRSAIS